MKYALVCGARGFISNNLVLRLKDEDWWVRGVGLNYPEYSVTVKEMYTQKVAGL